MSQLPSCLMTPREHDRLRQLAALQVCLELGAWEGVTTAVLAEVATQVWTVDHHHGDAFTGPRETLPAYWMNVEPAGPRPDVITIVGNFADVLPRLREHSFDLVLVDGAHDMQSVYHDVNWAMRLSRPGGIIAVHDWGRWDVQAACKKVLPLPGELTESLAGWHLPL